MMRRTTRLGAALLLSLLPAGAAAGQAQVGSGHALDGSLRVGDNGYNAPTQSRVSSLSATRYSAVSGRRSAYSPYTGGGTTNIRDGRITNYDVYLTDRSYSAGWQKRPTGGGGSAPSSSYNPGAYRIDGRAR